MTEVAQTQKTRRQCVTFQLDNETYAIDVMQVREVLRSQDIVPVPGAPSFVLGIINLRGNVVTVLDARMRFGLPTQPANDDSRIIILESGEQEVGMLIDSVAEVIEIDMQEVEPAPAVGDEASKRYVEGVVTRNDHLVIVVDLNRLLSENEWESLPSF